MWLHRNFNSAKPRSGCLQQIDLFMSSSSQRVKMDANGSRTGGWVLYSFCRASHVNPDSDIHCPPKNLTISWAEKSEEFVGHNIRIIGTIKILKGWVAMSMFCFSWLQEAVLWLLEIVFQAWENTLSANHPHEHGHAMMGQHQSMETYLYPWTSSNCLKWWTRFLHICTPACCGMVVLKLEWSSLAWILFRQSL